MRSRKFSASILSAVNAIFFISIVSSFLLFSFTAFSQNPLPVTNVDGGLKVSLANIGLSESVVTIGNTIYFVGIDNVHGQALWKYNTTTREYALVKDVYLGAGTESITNLVALNNKVYFTASADVNNGMFDVYMSDGTEAGTVLLFASNAAENFSGGTAYLLNAGSFIYFETQVTGQGNYLYSINGSTVTQLKQIYPGGYGPFGISLHASANYGGYFFFMGYDDTHGSELWRSDGTPAGTGVYADLSYNPPGGGGILSNFYDFVEVNNQLFFQGLYKNLETISGVPQEVVHSGLFKMASPSSAAVQFYDYVKNAAIGGSLGSGQKNGPAVLNNTLYFVGSVANSDGGDLWRTDGTTAGTYSVKHFTGGNPIGDIAKFNDKIIFAAYDGSDRSFWLSDGTAIGTHKIGDKFVNSGTIGKFYIRGNRIYASGYYDGITHAGNTAVWSTDGTNEGTVILNPDCYSTGTGPQDIFENIGDSIYFQGQNNGCIENTQLNKFTIPTKIWLGKISTDWNDANNWDPAGVPGNADDIVIPAGITNYPVVSANAVARNLWINWGSVTVTSGVQLTVNGELSVIGTLTGDGSLVMAAAGNDNLHGQGVINISSVIINGSDVTLKGNKEFKKVTFLNNGKIFLGDNNLVITDNASPVSGFNVNRYFVTNGTGAITLKNIDETGKVFPAGPSSAAYTPIAISNGNGDDFSVNVQATFTNAMNDANKTVRAQWTITKTGAPTGNSVTLTPQWNAGEEGSNFLRANSLVLGHYGDLWDEISAGPVSGPDANGLYSTTANGVSSFSPFGVGNTGAFMTSANSPTVTTSSATSVTNNSAISGGDVVSDGGDAVTTRGVVYATLANPTIAGTFTSDGAGTGSFISTLTGLSPNTQYFYRAYATNNANTAYGSENSFYTLANIPTAPVLSNATTTTYDISIGSGDNNTASTEYAIYSPGSGQYVQADGLLGPIVIWQTASTWGNLTISGIPSNASYEFKVKARNALNIETDFGPSAFLSTIALTPGAPTVNGATVSSLNVTIDANGNYPWTVFAIYEATTNKYVQADGSLGASAVWQTNANWGTKTVTGLMGSANYSFKVKAINQDNVETAFGGETSYYTLANIPTAAVLSNATITTLDIAIGSGDNNAATTEYAIFSQGDGPYVQANGLIGASPVWQTASAWGTTTINGLVSNGSYDFEVKARNGNNIETSFGPIASLSTLAIMPGASTVNGATLSSLNITIDVNGNYPWTKFAIHEATTNKFVQADGSLGTSAVWQTNADWSLKTVTGLLASTNYIFEVKAINQDNVETAYGPGANGSTLCNPISITGQPLISQTICQNSTPANLTVTTAGTGLSYQWYSNNSNSTIGATSLNPAGTSASFMPSAFTPGTLFYYCIVTSTCGTATSDFARVDINPIPLVNAGSYGPYYSSDAIVTLNGTPAGGTFSGPAVTGNSFNPSISGIGNHTITYSYTDVSTGCSNISTTIISVSTPIVPCNFTVDAIAGPGNACPYVVSSGVNATYSITATSASGYSWVLPAGATLASGTNTTSSIQVHYAANFVSGTISVTVSSLCGSPVTRTQLITKAIPPAPAAITGILNACPYIGTNIPVTYSIAPVAGALTYRWTLPATVTLISASPDSTSITLSFNNGFDAGANKSVKVKSISACGSSADRVLNISVTKPAVPAAITGPVNACIYIGTASEATYKTRMVTNATSFAWTVPAGATITSHPNGTGPMDTVITVAFDNSFVSPSNISVQSASGCGISVARTLAITRTIPATPGVITGPADACPLMGTAITGAYSIRRVTNALFYNWIVPAGATAIHLNGSGIYDTTIVVSYDNAFVSGAITVNASNGCSNSLNRSLTITRKVPPTPGVISGSTDPCPFIGVSETTYKIRKVANATSYTWSVPAGAIISGHPFGTGINDTAITVSFSNAVTAGNISVIANNNCASSLPRNLALAIKLPATPGAITGPTDLCPFIGFANVTYSIRKVANATSYSWSVPAGVIISGHPGGAGINDTIITVSFSNTAAAGNISVTANNNCATSLPRNLTITRKLPGVPGVITATVLSTTCPNRQIYYSIAALPVNASSVNWIVPVGGIVINQGTLGVTVEYNAGAISDTVRVVGVNNCASSAERKLKVVLPACTTASILGGSIGAKNAVASDSIMVNGFQVNIFPNPSAYYFRLQLISASGEVATMRVIDISGKQFISKVIIPNQINEFGNDLKKGVYFVEVIQGKNRQVFKLMKQN